MTTISKTAAIREARRAVGQPIRVSSTSYVVYGPYRRNEPSGPSTEHNYDSYTKAALGRAVWVAEVALALMGRLTDDASYAIDCAEYDPYAPHDVASLVAIGLASAR